MEDDVLERIDETVGRIIRLLFWIRLEMVVGTVLIWALVIVEFG
jgi:hypothetical protein